jgi:hypothetical protein
LAGLADAGEEWELIAILKMPESVPRSLTGMFQAKRIFAVHDSIILVLVASFKG